MEHMHVHVRVSLCVCVCEFVCMCVCVCVCTLMREIIAHMYHYQTQYHIKQKRWSISQASTTG